MVDIFNVEESLLDIPYFVGYNCVEANRLTICGGDRFIAKAMRRRNYMLQKHRIYTEWYNPVIAAIDDPLELAQSQYDTLLVWVHDCPESEEMNKLKYDIN